MTLAGRVAIITGAADGIGRATAMAFAESGAQLVVVDVNADGLDAFDAERITADVTDETSVADIARRALDRFGRIDSLVNVSSGAGLRGMSRNPAYAAAKAGVAALTRALAIDHGPNGVRVNAVAPGPIRTPLMDRNRTPEEIDAMGSVALLGRIGRPEEVAAAILWLASDASSYVVGQTIEVDGGPAALV